MKSCATCAHSRFLRLGSQNCLLLHQRVDDDWDCENFVPLIVDPPGALSVRPLPVVEVV